MRLTLGAISRSGTGNLTKTALESRLDALNLAYLNPFTSRGADGTQRASGEGRRGGGREDGTLWSVEGTGRTDLAERGRPERESEKEEIEKRQRHREQKERAFALREREREREGGEGEREGEGEGMTGIGSAISILASSATI